ncbi:UDP-glucuronosyltransferase 2B1-like [Diadema setosum]|uniref:UDP-glucuronosyltransferase 2B1-like n=1 Tax=Diadema setosum TaxID=31175 RepID=UPI003B3A460B
MKSVVSRWTSTWNCFLLKSLVLVCASLQVESANILLSGVFGDGSHYFSIVPIGRSLLQKGHNVTFLVADEYLHKAVDISDSEFFNFEVFHFPGLKEKMNEMYGRLGEVTFTESTLSKQKQLFQRMNIINGQACRGVFEDPELLERMRWYDAYVLDVAWPCGVFVKSYLEGHKDTKDIPIAIFAPMVPIPFIFDQSGSPFIPSYQPVAGTSFSSSASMSFLERCKNAFFYLYFITSLNREIFLSPYFQLVSDYNLDPELTSSISVHVDLYFINSDFSVEFPFSVMPNVIPVGGVTSRPANLLDEDLEEFMESSGEHGVIVFSLGSYFAEITTTHPDVVDLFIEAFSQIPQKVIMHLKKLPPRQLPDNIKALPWLPLNDLMGHPKTLAVLYHGGNNGYYEALYHGVPLVVMPLAGDQHDVAVRVLSKGLGTKIDKNRLSTEHIYEQLNEVLSNPKYRATAKRLSATFRDRPMKPADTAAFWIEHVIKHGGEHLRPPTLDIPFYQIYMLDIATAAIICIMTISFIVIRAIRYCCCSKNRLKAKRE